MKKNKECEFCGRNNNSNYVKNKNINICEFCILICNQIIESEITEKEKIKIKEYKNIKDIKKKLDKYIIGQKDAKISIAVSIYNHIKRIKYNHNNKNEIMKSNIIMTGETGCGKTLIVQSLQKITKLPIVITDATSLTEAGYVGDDVETIIYKLIIKSNYNIKKAEAGIIYIDEIDKIAKKKNVNNYSGRDISGEGVQQSLLKILEGTVLNINLKQENKNTITEPIQINTDNILFICGGVFKFSKNKRFKNISYIKEKTRNNYNIKSENLIKEGLIPEFVGRLPYIANFKKLKTKDLELIITKPKNSILKQYKILMEFQNSKIKITKNAIKQIAKMALKLKIGARGVRSILEKYFIKLMYKINNKKSKVIINKNNIKKNKYHNIQYEKK